MADEKDPIPMPLLVLVDKDIVGNELVDHTTPLALTVAPPSKVIFPPDEEELVVIPVIEFVLSIGMEFIHIGLPSLSTDEICPGRPGARIIQLFPFQ